VTWPSYLVAWPFTDSKATLPIYYSWTYYFDSSNTNYRPSPLPVLALFIDSSSLLLLCPRLALLYLRLTCLTLLLHSIIIVCLVVVWRLVVTLPVLDSLFCFQGSNQYNSALYPKRRSQLQLIGLSTSTRSPTTNIRPELQVLIQYLAINQLSAILLGPSLKSDLQTSTPLLHSMIVASISCARIARNYWPGYDMTFSYRI